VLHNKLTRPSKIELLIIKGDDDKTYVARTTYVQDIEAYTFRDRSRPRRDAYVGMLPPKLAQTMINLTGSRPAKAALSGEGSTFPVEADKNNNQLASAEPDADMAAESELSVAPRLLDPFCGTGVVLQEAALMGYAVYGTDLSERMIRYTRDNLLWLSDTHHVLIDKYFHVADAQDAAWQQPVDVVVGEGYLGKPLSTTPDRELLESIVYECNDIMKNFLKNISAQLAAGTPLCIAAPAWHIHGDVRHLAVLEDLEKLGFTRRTFKDIDNVGLIYRREDQIVGRELLVLTKK
jgi:tRNA G10  N-methylase Trm11